MGNLSDDILKYKKGEMSPPEMHALEKKALVDPFLAEALEGVENISPDELTAAVSSLQHRITNTKKKIIFTPLRIAAGIGLLLGSALFIYQLAPKPATIALKTENLKPNNKNADEEKVDSGSQGDVVKEKPGSQSGTSKIESQAMKPETATRGSGGTPSPLKHDEQPSAKVQREEPKNENSEAETVAPVQPAPVLDLAVQDQATNEIAGDQKTQGVIGPDQKTMRAKAVAREKKKASFEKADAQRSAVPAVKIEPSVSMTGRVVSSEDGLPMPGVNVVVKGTAIGTVTDSHGNYKIAAGPDNRMLVFSFIGFQPQEVDASGRDQVDVQMKDDVSQLSEVVVTSMGLTADDDQATPVIRWAEPEGGRKAYDAYLESHVKYPDEALRNKIKGKSGIAFTVGTDGSLRDFRVIKKLGYGCEDEIIRLVKAGPAWHPTTEGDKPIESTVRVRMRFDPSKAGR